MYVSKIGEFHTLALSFKDWPFDVIVIRYSKPKSDHLKETVYCKLIDRTLKILLTEELGSSKKQMFPQSSENTKKYSFEYSVCKSGTKYI